METEKIGKAPSSWPVAVVILLLLVLFFPCGGPVVKVRHQSRTVACSNNLKQLGLAARMYLNDHAVFPHASGGKGPVPGRTHIQLLFDGGYIDDPEVVICPASPDVPAPMDDEGRFILKVIGGRASNCSYLWARAPLTDRSPESAALAACSLDHKGGRNVLYLRGNVRWVPEEEFQKLAGTLTRE